MNLFAKLFVAALAAFTLSIPSFAQAPFPSGNIITTTAAVGDYCANANVAKLEVPVAITTATTTELVPAVAGKTTYVCGFVATVSGTNPTLTFKTGTKVSTACDTGAASLTGAITPTTAVVTAYQWDHNMTYMTSAAAGEVCLTTAGTPAVNGFLIYVQR